MAFHEPATHSSLAALLEQHEDALLLAGGTQLMRRMHGSDAGEERTVISLRGMESMARISRSQRFIDIGSMVTLSRILSIGPNVIPESLFGALKSIATPSVRLLATLGGNICASDTEHTALAPLALLEAQLELRSGTSSRWVAASQFWSGGTELAVERTEVLTRVRLPLEESDEEVFLRSAVEYRGRRLPLGFCASVLARKNIVEALRIAISFPPTGTHRLEGVESGCAGSRLPLRDRSVGDLLTLANDDLTELNRGDPPGLEGAGAMVLRLTRWYLLQLGGRRETGESARRALQRPGAGAILT